MPTRNYLDYCLDYVVAASFYFHRQPDLAFEGIFHLSERLGTKEWSSSLRILCMWTSAFEQHHNSHGPEQMADCNTKTKTTGIARPGLASCFLRSLNVLKRQHMHHTRLKTFPPILVLGILFANPDGSSTLIQIVP
jgi:hypothetical protein